MTTLPATSTPSPTLEYQPRAATRGSLCFRLSIIASVSSILLLASALAYGQLVVEPAYDAVRKAITPAASLSTYDHYSTLKAFAVTVFLVSVAFCLIGLITAIISAIRDPRKKPAALALLLSGAAVLFILFLIA